MTVNKYKYNQSLSNNPGGLPSKSDKAAGDLQKEINIKKGEKQGTNSTRANLVITDARQYEDVIEVRSFITNQYKDGTCTFTFSKEGFKVVKFTSAFRDVSTTICSNPLINRSEFATSGSWQLVVAYSSESSNGESKPIEVILK